MIDIHNHILPGVDDGSKSIEESIRMIKNAYNAGVTDIILTPHFILNTSYSYERVQEESIFDDLKVKLDNENIKVNIYLGNEVFVENNLYDLLKEKKFHTLANSNYLMFELSLNNYYHGINELLFELNSNNIKPVLAHPERYSFLQNNPSLIEDLYNRGAILQLDASSFYGKYGKNAKRLFVLLIKHHYASFIASDSHSDNDNSYLLMKKLQIDLLKYISKAEIDILFNENPKKIINNESIFKFKTIPFKKSFFNKWK